MKRSICVASTLALLAGAFYCIHAQQGEIQGNIEKRGGKATIAIPDFRGAGQAQAFMATFNTTLHDEIENSGLFSLVPKSLMPLNVPQQPQDFRQAPVAG